VKKEISEKMMGKRWVKGSERREKVNDLLFLGGGRNPHR